MTAPDQALLQHKLIVVIGKGGVGKTTIAGTLGLLAARQGKHTIVVEVGERQHLPELLDQPPAPTPGTQLQLAEHLWSLSVDPDRVLADWLRALSGRISTRVLLSSSTFQYFVAAAPGAREMLSMVEVASLTGAGPHAPRVMPRMATGTVDAGKSTRRQSSASTRRQSSAGTSYDLVILDAPATGHALAMLRSPRTFAGLARVGPIAGQARAVDELLRDRNRCGYVAVTQGTEMAVSETIELQSSLREQLGRELDMVIFNAALPRRFAEPELRAITATSSAHPVGGAAVLAASTVHERARMQNNQLARLRRRKLPLLRLPFLFQPRLDRPALQQLADRLERGLVS
jgi:anion-transporting  ArsA/GET3 family ATPase